MNLYCVRLEPPRELGVLFKGGDGLRRGNDVLWAPPEEWLGV